VRNVNFYIRSYLPHTCSPQINPLARTLTIESPSKKYYVRNKKNTLKYVSGTEHHETLSLHFSDYTRHFRLVLFVKVTSQKLPKGTIEVEMYRSNETYKQIMQISFYHYKWPPS